MKKDLTLVTNDYLIRNRVKLMDIIEKDKTQEFIKQFHQLLEIERELTLREGI